MKKCFSVLLALFCFFALSSSAFAATIAAPEADVSPGGIASGTEVTLSCDTAGADIYYTLDGTAPTVNATQYTTPIRITASTRIVAVAIKGGAASELAAFSYQTDNLYTYEQLYDFEAPNDDLGFSDKEWQIQSQFDSGVGPSAAQNGKKVLAGTMPEPDQGESTSTISVSNKFTSLLRIDAEKNPALSFWVWCDATYGEKDMINGLINNQKSVENVVNLHLKADTPGWYHYCIDLSDFDGYRVYWQLDFESTEGKKVYIDDVSLVSMATAPVKLAFDNDDNLFYENAKLTMAAATGTEISYFTITDGERGNDAKYNEAFAPETNTSYVAWAKNLKNNAYSATTALDVGLRHCAPVEIEFFEYDDGSIDVSFRCATQGALIYYVLNKGEVERYTKPFRISQKTHIQFLSMKEGMEPSLLIEGMISPDQISAVTASVDDGVAVERGTSVALTCNTLGAEIYYTTDGSLPSATHGSRYDKPIIIDEDMTVTAMAINSAGKSSETSVFRYTVAAEGDIFESNNSLAYATSLSFPSQIEANITPAGSDVDYYAFTVASPCNLELRLTADGGNAFGMTLIDGNGKELKEKQGTKAIGMRYAATGGQYCVKITGSSGDYTLRLTKQSDGQAIDLSEKNLLFQALDSDNKNAFFPGDGVNSGGHYLMASAVLARWNGVVDEADDPYDPVSYDADGAPDLTKWLPVNDAEQQYHISDILWLPQYQGDTAILKSAVYSYGAVMVSYYNDWNCFRDNDTYYYYPYSYNTMNGGSHAVTLVGWDDSIPKEEFVTAYGDMPDHDGAFICKNSWGSTVGEEGYFYISYECQRFSSPNAPVVFVAAESTENYNVKYEYDPLGLVSAALEFFPDYMNLEIGYAKNTFTAENDFDLEAISFFNYNGNANIDLFVQLGDGKTKKVASCYEQYGGYHTVRLTESIAIEKGQEFSVILANDTGEIPLEAPDDYYALNAEAEAGQSFISKDGVHWLDCSADIGANCCIKVFGHSDAAIKKTSSMPQSFRAITAESAVSLSAVEDDGNINEAALGSSEAPLKAQPATAAAPYDTLPSAFDLRDINAITDAKDQGRVGSCWSFGAIAALESTLLRTNTEGYAYPVSVAVDKTAAEMELTDGVPTADFSATATLTPVNCGTDIIYWNFEGDLDSIDILTRQSVSGEKAALFTAKAAGVVTVTATSAADTSKQATVTVTIVNHKLSEWENPYGDVASGHWSYAHIWYVTINGLMVGYDDGNFYPENGMTRAMAVAVIARLAGVNVDDYTERSFDDVAGNRWYAGYVQWAYEAGITAGINEKEFGPEELVTREEMAAFLYRYAKPATVDPDTLKAFDDGIKVSKYAVKPMAWAVETGIYVGYNDGLLHPQAYATRGQMAAVLERFATKIK